MRIYWKKVKGHSRTPGEDKLLNDQADNLAKQGAQSGTPWVFNPSQFPSPSTPAVLAITRRQAKAGTSPLTGTTAATAAVLFTPAFSDSDLVALQTADPAIHKMALYLSDP